MTSEEEKDAVRLLQRAEIEVVNSILLREDYLARIKTFLEQSDEIDHEEGVEDIFPKDPLKRNLVEVLNLLDMIRLSTVESVEAIEKWRAAVAFARAGGKVQKRREADGEAKK